MASIALSDLSRTSGRSRPCPGCGEAQWADADIHRAGFTCPSHCQLVSGGWVRAAFYSWRLYRHDRATYTRPGRYAWFDSRHGDCYIF